MTAAKRNEQRAGTERVVDSEGQTAPVTNAPQAQPGVQAPAPQGQPAAADQPAPAESRQQGGDTKVKYVGRGIYEHDGKQYQRGEVYEVDQATADELLSSRGSRGENFVQAD